MIHGRDTGNSYNLGGRSTQELLALRNPRVGLFIGRLVPFSATGQGSILSAFPSLTISSIVV